MLPRVVLERAHGPIGVQPGNEQRKEGASLLQCAIAGTLGMTPVLPLPEQLKLEFRQLSWQWRSVRLRGLNPLAVLRQYRRQSRALPVAAIFRSCRARKVPC